MDYNRAIDMARTILMVEHTSSFLITIIERDDGKTKKQEVARR